MEVILVIFLLGTILVPLMESLSPSFTGRILDEETTRCYNAARATLSKVTDLSFLHLEAHMGDPLTDISGLLGGTFSTESEKITINGVEMRPEISILDASTGIGGLLEIKVSIGRIHLKTMKTDY